MRWLRRALRLLLHKQRMEADLDQEVRSSIAILTDRYIARGMNAEEARRAALTEAGGIEPLKEKIREVRMGALLESFVYDLRHGVRTLRRDRRFATLAVLTAALGIGINAAVFSALYAVVLKPLPYRQSGAVAIIFSHFQHMGAPRAPGSGHELRELQRRSRLFEGIAGIWVGRATLRTDTEPEQIKVADVTTNFFDVLGAQPSLGRAFAPDDFTEWPPKIAVISDAFWHRRFGGDPKVLGQPLRLGYGTVTVAGVMPPGFRLYFPPDANVPADVPVFVPFGKWLDYRPRDLYFIRYIGRLRPGVTLPQAQADLDSVAAYLRATFPEYGKENLKLHAATLHSDAVREVRPGLSALMAGAVLVLLIACVNVANLLLARGAGRRREIAVRSAIGASSGRVVRQLLAESLVLGVISGLAGTAIGWAGVRALNALRPESLARLGEIRLSLAVLLFVVAVSLVSSLLFGLAPALQALRLNLIDALRSSGRAVGMSGSGARRVLVIAEVTLGFVLLTGAGLMALTFHRLHQTSPGFDPAHVLTFELQPQGENPASIISFVDECERRLRALPGVQAVGAISHLPLDDYPNWYSPYHPEGMTDREAKGMLADHRAITPGYFAAMSARLLEGRMFNADDRTATGQVVIVDDLLARTTWPGQTAIGKRLSVEQYTGEDFRPAVAQVVGVVRHIHQYSLTTMGRGQIYIPFTQSPREHLTFVVRTSGDPLAIAGPVRRQLRGLDKDMAIAKLAPMTDYVQRAAAPVTFNAVIAIAFGGLGLVLATVGVYSVIAYAVSQRTQEFGVRMALGAQPAAILRLVIADGFKLTTAGIAMGVACALLLGRYLQALLFGVRAADPPTYAAAAGAIVLASFFACWIPALRAARGSVSDALRLE